LVKLRRTQNGANFWATLYIRTCFDLQWTIHGRKQEVAVCRSVSCAFSLHTPQHVQTLRIHTVMAMHKSNVGLNMQCSITGNVRYPAGIMVYRPNCIGNLISKLQTDRPTTESRYVPRMIRPNTFAINCLFKIY